MRPEGRRPFNARILFDAFGLEFNNSPYLSQIPCSWGAVYFPEIWREFHSYLAGRLSKTWLTIDEHVVPHVRSNKWMRSWKKFFIELVYLRGYVMLYPNYEGFLSLSTNHLEVGSHVKESPRSIYDQKKALFTLPLMKVSQGGPDGSSVTTGLLDLPEERLSDWHNLPVLDLFGNISSEEELIDRGLHRREELAACTMWNGAIEHRTSFDARDLFNCDSFMTNSSKAVGLHQDV